jgi:hypothetical protein
VAPVCATRCALSAVSQSAVHARGGAQPIIVSPYSVFGGQFPGWLRHVLDVPGYWLIVLPVELPAAFIAGVIALGAALRGVMPCVGFVLPCCYHNVLLAARAARTTTHPVRRIAVD